MTPVLQIVLGAFFMLGGGFVVILGRQARRAQVRDGAPPLPTFFLVAYYIHVAITLVGAALVARGVYALVGGA